MFRHARFLPEFCLFALFFYDIPCVSLSYRVGRTITITSGTYHTSRSSCYLSSSLLVGYVLSLSRTIIFDMVSYSTLVFTWLHGENLIKNTGKKLVTLHMVQRRVVSTVNNGLVR